MASGHLTDNQEYLKHKEALDYWKSQVLKDTCLPKSPSKSVSKNKGRKKETQIWFCVQYVLDIVGACFIHLTSFSLYNDNIWQGVTEEEIESQESEDPPITQITAGTLGFEPSFQVHELSYPAYHTCPQDIPDMFK